MELIPALKYIPERWASWKEKLRDLRAREVAYSTRLLEGVRARLEGDGSAGEPCLMQTACERQEELNLSETTLRSACPSDHCPP